MFDAEAREVWRGTPNPFRLPNLRVTESAEESMAINRLHSGAIIIAGNGMASPDPDAGFGGPDAGNVAPEPNFADSGMDAVSADNGNVDNGNFDASTMAPDPGMDDGGSVAAGDAADAASGGDGRKGHHNHD